MDGSHFENTLAMCSLEVCYLDHNGQYLNQVDQSYDQDKQGHLQHIGHASHKAAKCQGTSISHKYACRIYVVKQKSHQSADNRTGNRLNSGLCSNGYHGKEHCHDQGNACGKAINTVCEVHAIDSSDHGKKQNRNRKPSKVQIMSAPERNAHSQGYIGIFQQIEGENTGYNHLKQELLPGKKSI